MLQLHDLQPLKEMLLSLKITLQGAQQERFAKTTRTAKVVEHTTLYQLPYKRRFIHIQITLSSDFLKRLDTQWKFLQCCCHIFCAKRYLM